MSRIPVTPFAMCSCSDDSPAASVCACISQRPGIRNLPRPSTTRASRGDAAPCVTLVIVVPSIRTVLFGMIRPSTTSTMFAPVITSGRVCGVTALELARIAAAVSTRNDVVRSAIDFGFLRPECSATDRSGFAVQRGNPAQSSAPRAYHGNLPSLRSCLRPEFRTGYKTK